MQVRIRKNPHVVNQICLLHMPDRPDLKASNYLENRLGICYKEAY
jgi:hypothetical protein